MPQTLIVSSLYLATQCCRPQNSVRSNNLSLNSQRLMLIGCKYTESRKFEFMQRTQILCIKYVLYLLSWIVCSNDYFPNLGLYLIARFCTQIYSRGKEFFRFFSLKHPPATIYEHVYIYMNVFFIIY